MSHHHKRSENISGGVFLIGLAMLFITGWWWPGILFVIGASVLSKGMVQGRGFSEALPLFAIGIFFMIGFKLLPLILIMIGVGMLFGWNKYRTFQDNDWDDFTIDNKPKRKSKNSDLSFDEELDFI